MTRYAGKAGARTYEFRDLKELLAKATPLRSGDCLAGIAATDARERAAAQVALADVPLAGFLEEITSAASCWGFRWDATFATPTARSSAGAGVRRGITASIQKRISGIQLKDDRRPELT